MLVSYLAADLVVSVVRVGDFLSLVSNSLLFSFCFALVPDNFVSIGISPLALLSLISFFVRKCFCVFVFFFICAWCGVLCSSFAFFVFSVRVAYFFFCCPCAVSG